jgi:hypothetical protein
MPSSDGLSGIGLACARAGKAGAAAGRESVLMAARVMHGRARPRRGFPGQARPARIPAAGAPSAAACSAVPGPSDGPDQRPGRPCAAGARQAEGSRHREQEDGKACQGERERIMGAWADPVPAPGGSRAAGQRALSASSGASITAVTNWAWTCANRVTSGPGPPLGRGVRAGGPRTRPGGLPAAAGRAQPGTEDHKTAASASQSAKKPADAGILGGCCGRRADGWSAGTVN